MVGEPSLTVAATGPKRRLVNRPAVYRITVSNPGTVPLTNVTVSSEVTEGMTLVSATEGSFVSARQTRHDRTLQRDVTYQEVRWTIRALAVGERRTLQMVLQSATEGSLFLRAYARADSNLESRAQVETVFEEMTGPTLEIDKSADPIEIGSTITYKLRVINQGDGAANNVSLTVLVPDEMAIVTDILNPNARVEGQKATFSQVLLAKKGTVEFTLELKALKPGEVRLLAELICDQLRKGGPIQVEESTTIYRDAPAK